MTTANRLCACGEPVAKNRSEQCEGCYQRMHRAGIRLREVESLGPDKARFEFKGPAELRERLHAAVPLDARSRFMRDAVREKLDRMASVS